MAGLCGIYKIQSIIKPERCYIGSSIDIHRRWSDHLLNLRKNIHPTPKLQSHYNKYGKNDLIFSILIGCDNEDLISTEQFFIDSHRPWFNVLSKAGSNKGHRWTEEQKANLRDIRSRKPHPMLGKHHTEESKQKNRNAHKNIQKGKDHPMYGKHHSPDAIEKIKVARKLQTHTRKGIPQSEEAKKRIREKSIYFTTGNIPWNKGLKKIEGVDGKITKLKVA